MKRLKLIWSDADRQFKYVVGVCLPLLLISGNCVVYLILKIT